MRRMMRRCFPLYLAGVIAVAGIARAEDLLEEKPAEQGDVSLQLPKGWQVEEKGEGRSLLRAHAAVRDKDDTGDFQAVVIVTADAGVKVDANAQQARAAKDFSDYKITEEPGDVTINGMTGLRFGGSFTVGSVKLRTRQYMLLRDGKVYTLTFMGLASKWTDYAPAIDAAAATFRIPAK